MTSRRPKDQRRLKVVTELPKEAPKRGGLAAPATAAEAPRGNPPNGDGVPVATGAAGLTAGLPAGEAMAPTAPAPPAAAEAPGTAARLAAGALSGSAGAPAPAGGAKPHPTPYFFSMISNILSSWPLYFAKNPSTLPSSEGSCSV